MEETTRWIPMGGLSTSCMIIRCRPAGAPEIDANIVDSYDPTAPFGVKERVKAYAADHSGVVNAIYDAIGKVYRSATTPEKVSKR